MSHKADAMNCASRIVNTMLIQDRVPEDMKLDDITTLILKHADKFAEWLGPDPIRAYGGGGGAPPKPTWKDPCPVCKGEMFDLTASKKNSKGPDARCKDTKWDNAQGIFTGCSGLVWPPKPMTERPSSNEYEDF